MLTTCENCTNSFDVTEEDLVFYDKASPVYEGVKCSIPPPRQCPKCRLIRRSVWRNEYTYYQRNCDRCGCRIIAVHAPDAPYPVYCNPCWWSDSWEPVDYGQEIDFSRNFVEQFKALQARVPKPAMANDNHLASKNIEYCQGLAYSKNCYLVTTAWRLEDSLYSTNCGESKELVDCRFVGVETEIAYECTNCQRIYGCSFLDASENCTECHFGIDLRACSNCFCCFGLRQKQFHIFNKAYTKEKYWKKIDSFKKGAFSGQERVKKEFADFLTTFPRRFANQINCENCEGSNIFNCKNFEGFNVFGGEDCRFYFLGTRPQFCYDILVGGEHQWCYEGVNPDHSYMSHYTVWCWKDKYVLYSDNCHSSEHLFACIGLRFRKHCILNKEYPKEKYEQLVRRLISHMTEKGEWGEFFPITASPFAYNETIAQDHFPLSQEDILSRGYRWKERERKKYEVASIEVADHIQDVSDDILGQVLGCKECGSGYKITPLELKFYRKIDSPIPRFCPQCRKIERFSRSGSYELWDRSCAECETLFKTPYSPEDPVRVLCEECYLKFIYE